jgi:hypothetical protein
MKKTATVLYDLRYCILIIIILFPLKITSQNLLSNPESVLFDELHNRYLVTCNGNGKIISVDNAGIQDTFKIGFSNLLGSHISENTIYVSSNNGVQGFDLTDKTEVFHVPIPGAGQIDGITTDTSGNLYVIDGIYRRIYKINISTKTYTTFVTSGLPPYPQDCIFDEENNRLLVVAWANNAPIQAVSLSDSTVTNVVSTNFGLFDGITKDQFGNVYVSSHHGAGKIYKYDKNFANTPELISSGHIEPAGLGYNTRDNILAIPNYGSHTIDFIQINVSSVIRDQREFVNSYKLYQNYPNPFNPSTKIKYQIPEISFVILKIYDVLGNEIATLVNEELPAGKYEVEFSMGLINQTLPSGVYFYQLYAGSFVETKKMVLIK